jgi:hypothetical protein
VSKEWQATPDQRTRETHRIADGQRVPLTAPFQVGGASLMFPGDPTGPVGELANCRCSLGYLFEETTLEDQEQPGPLVAAAEVHTGAMVALIPSETDARRLAVEGGEPVDQLHITLMYLGTAADIPDEAKTQIVSTLQQTAAGWPALEVDGFAVSIFNPPGYSSLADGIRASCSACPVTGSSTCTTLSMMRYAALRTDSRCRSSTRRGCRI